MIVLNKLVLLVVASAVGIGAGVVVATPVIAVLNENAADGPNFTPVLVALLMLAIPVGVLLLLVQAPAAGYELVTRRSLGWTWLLLGGVTGAAAGLYWSVQLDPTPSSLARRSALTAFGMIQGLAAFGVHARMSTNVEKRSSANSDDLTSPAGREPGPASRSQDPRP